MKFTRSLCICFVLCLTQAAFSANYTVTKIADTNDGTCDADCSLREAVAVANGTADNDTIYFALPFFATPRMITLSGSEIVITNNGSLTIHGTGANRLTISGNNASRILSINGATANIDHILFIAGTGAGAANTGRGGAIYNNGGTTVISHCVIAGNTGANGGAMNNATAGTLTITNSVLSGNQATSVGGALQNFSTSTLHIINTAITGNACGTSSTGGGAMQGNGAITMTNVTMSGNASQASGGGIYYNGTGLTMTNTTITGNQSASNAGGFHKSTATNNANIRNSIISGNVGAVASPDITNVINSQGNNIIGVVGTSTGWVGSDLQNQNPLLSPLGSYGGSGFSNAVLTGSPALNAGQNCVKNLSCAANNPPVAVIADQRGAVRADTVDIGAFEVSPAYLAVLPSGQLSQPYSHIFTSTAGSFTYAVTGGTIPPSLIMNSGPVNASITGTPTVKGAYDFAITVSSGANLAVLNYQLNILDDLLIVPVSGRVTNAAGNGLGRVTVVLTNQNGVSRSATTGPFGYFQFDDLAAGATYTVTISSKQYTLAPQIVTIPDAYRSLDLTASPL